MQAYRIIAKESGTHFATVYSREQARADRRFYSDRYSCRCIIRLVKLERDPRW